MEINLTTKPIRQAPLIRLARGAHHFEVYSAHDRLKKRYLGFVDDKLAFVGKRREEVVRAILWPAHPHLASSAQ